MRGRAEASARQWALCPAGSRKPSKGCEQSHLSRFAFQGGISGDSLENGFDGARQEAIHDSHGSDDGETCHG